jgi:hypothetical protein
MSSGNFIVIPSPLVSSLDLLSISFDELGLGLDLVLFLGITFIFLGSY